MFSRVRPDHPRCRSDTWICVCGHTRDPIIYSKFHRNSFRGSGAPGGQNLAFPITLPSRFYNSLYYRTSRDLVIDRPSSSIMLSFTWFNSLYSFFQNSPSISFTSLAAVRRIRQTINRNMPCTEDQNMILYVIIAYSVTINLNSLWCSVENSSHINFIFCVRFYAIVNLIYI